MLEIPQFHVPAAERDDPNKEGVVLIIINPLNGDIVYGLHNTNGDRGNKGEWDINAESRDECDSSFLVTLERLGQEELGAHNFPQTWVGDDLADHYLGTAWFGQGVLAHVFWAYGLPANFHPNGVSAESEYPQDDFLYLGFEAVKALITGPNLRWRVKSLLESLDITNLAENLRNQSAMLLARGNLQPIAEAIKAYGTGTDPEFLDL